MRGDLTDPYYWSERQKHSASLEVISTHIPEWFCVIEPFLKNYEGKTFLELGCSPGHASSLICRRIRFIPFGIDYSPESYTYKKNMEKIGCSNARLFIKDIRQFEEGLQFDIVASFGLIEHFKYPDEIMFHHHRLAKPGGLIIMVIPNFKYLQWIYHFLFDRKDLSFHNIRVMNLNTFLDFSQKYRHKILYLDYVGRLHFWNVNLIGLKIIVSIRRKLSRVVRDFSNKILAGMLPANLKYYAPWIVYVAKKQ